MLAKQYPILLSFSPALFSHAPLLHLLGCSFSMPPSSPLPHPFPSIPPLLPAMLSRPCSEPARLPAVLHPGPGSDPGKRAQGRAPRSKGERSMVERVVIGAHRTAQRTQEPGKCSLSFAGSRRSESSSMHALHAWLSPCTPPPNRWSEPSSTSPPVKRTSSGSTRKPSPSSTKRPLLLPPTLNLPGSSSNSSSSRSGGWRSWGRR